MPDWLIVLSTVIGLGAGIITVYEFVRKPNRMRGEGLADGKISAIGKSVFWRLLNYARFEYLLTRIGGFVWFVGGLGSVAAASNEDEKNLFVVLFIVSGIVLYGGFVYPLRMRAVKSIRRSATKSGMYDECIDQIAANSGIHQYRLDGIRKVVHECIKELRK